MPKNFKLSPKIILIGIVILAVLCIGGGGLGSLFGGLLGGNNSAGTTQNIPQTGDYVQGELGQWTAARSISNAGCPEETTQTFSANEPIYAALTESDIPANTSIFARLLYEGQPLEDTQAVVADQDMQNTCVWFAFEPNAGFDSGDYSVQLFVNGNLADETKLSVSGNGFFSSNMSSLDLGQVVTTNNVTSNGCPRSRVTSFSAFDTVYVAMEESSIPAGTEAFARLYYDGRMIEETDAVTADQDLNTCLWFAFEPGTQSGAGFDPGRYQAEMYVNNDVVDTINFQVVE